MEDALIDDDVITHCQSNKGMIDSDAFDRILLKHGLIDSVPGKHEPERGLLTRQRDVFRRRLNRRLMTARGLSLRLLYRATAERPSQYRLDDRMITAMATFRDAPEATERRLRKLISDFARPWLEGATRIAKTIGPQGAEMWREYAVAKTIVHCHELARDLHYSLRMAENNAGIDWPSELRAVMPAAPKPAAPKPKKRKSAILKE